VALGGDDLALAGRERLDDMRARVAFHRVLAPDRHLRILRMMGVVREDDDPAVLARMCEQACERLDDRLRPRVGELAIDEVVEHVHDDESLHSAILRLVCD
jgi:hypothetical protein